MVPLSHLNKQLAHSSINSQEIEMKFTHQMKLSLFSTLLLQITMKNKIAINNRKFILYLTKEYHYMSSNKIQGNKLLWITTIIGALSAAVCTTSSRTHHQEEKGGRRALPTTSFWRNVLTYKIWWNLALKMLTECLLDHRHLERPVCLRGSKVR